MISRRNALVMLAATAAFPWATLAQSASASRKKGWCGGNPDLHDLFKVHWYYNWMPVDRSPGTAEFVPMIKSERSTDALARIEDTSGISSLLGFNEPERESQGNLSLERALELWPQLGAVAERRNLRLGSPAPSSDKKGMDWFHAFMTMAIQRKLRVDFIAMHWYRSRSAEAFEAFVRELTSKYRLPIWITEFNGWSGTEPENYEFLRGALRFLESSRGNVERYAYFNPPAGKPHSLLAEDGSLTRMGKLYRDT